MTLSDPNNDGMVTPGELAGSVRPMRVFVNMFGFARTLEAPAVWSKPSLHGTHPTSAYASDVIILAPGEESNVAPGFCYVHMVDPGDRPVYPPEVIDWNGSSTDHPGVVIQVRATLTNLTTREQVGVQSEYSTSAILNDIPDDGDAVLPWEPSDPAAELGWYSGSQPIQVVNPSSTDSLLVLRHVLVLFDAFYE